MAAHCLRFFLILVLFLAAACGKPDDKDRCQNVNCEAGVCNPLNGMCANPASCGDISTCIDGYECVQSACVAEFACGSDGSCERGECNDEGACVNPDRCDADIDCVPGSACDGDQCIPDRCDQVECASGVCEQDTGECVNAAVCTAATQDADCIAGYTCYDQTCADEATVCADLACDRGECSFLDLDCVNPEDCAGDDLNCLAGSFCNAVNQCQQNVCDENGTTCPRGVCEASTGACINGATCAAATDCIDGFYCIDGACADAMMACDVCAGNQLCTYDDASVTLTCEEDPAGCVTSIDCVGSRECAAGACGAPVPCVADALEPNDSAAAALDWFALTAPVRGSICPGDSDFFSFDVSQDPQFTGTLIALLTIPAADIGVGTLALELLDEQGAVVASVTSQPADQFVRIEYAIGNINQGTYTLSIRGGTLGDGGIEYDLFMDLADDATVAMCQNAAALGATQTGDTSASTSNGLGSNCVVDATSTEEAWLLDVPSPSYATITLQSPGFDGVLSLRAQCEADSSELSCANDLNGAGTETLGQRLAPGSYFVVVQGAGSAASGAYTIDVALEPVVCTSMDNSCVDPNNASVCNARGTGFDSVACTNGCDDTIGACLREIADACTTAIDATGGYTGQVALGLLQNDYNPAAGCGPSLTSVADGPDAVFSVTLQPNDVLDATARPVDFDDIGVYLLSDCADPSGSCAAGQDDAGFGGDEFFFYTNMTAAPQDLFFVVDSEAGTLGAVDVEIVIAQAICTPAMTQCNGMFLETCNAAGTAYDTRSCAFGCDVAAAACTPPPNDVCGAGAIDVSAGGQFTGLIEDYANDYSATNSCTGFSSNGAEAVYSLTGTVGDVVTVVLDASYDTSLYAVTDCADIGGTCLDGSDAFGSPETIQFVIQDANPVYIIADAFSSSPTGTYTLDVTIQTPDCTNIGEAIGCLADGVTLQYCDDLGFFADYTCSTTCTGIVCDAPTGDRCFDAPVLMNGSSVSGAYTDLTPSIDPGTGTCISNAGLPQRGPDAMYQIDLLAGDLLTANLTTTTSAAGMYVVTDCFDAANTCVWAEPQSDTLDFFTATGGTYFLVVDSTSQFSTVAFTLDVTVANGFVCQPDTAVCDTNSNTLTVCNNDGTLIENTLTCAYGCGNTTACAGPTTPNDACVDAELITGSITIADNWNRFTNLLDPGQTSPNSCDFSSFETDGPEAIYTVALGAGQVLEVSLDDLGAFGSPALYIATDCNDTENTCVRENILSPEARVGYNSELGETVFVIADNTDGTVDDPFVIDFDIRVAECAPSLNNCVDANTREFCDEFGARQTEPCFFGCAAGACTPPTNDTCATPTDLSAGGVATIPYAGYMNDYGMNSIGCTGFTANGPDAVFSVTASANDLITARLSAPSSDTSIWMTTTCGDELTCVAGSDSAGFGSTDEFTYQVPADGTFYIHADAFTSSPSGSFTLEVIVSPPICIPGQAACDTGGQNVEVCDGIGSSVEVFACDGAGCVGASSLCATQTGEHPAAAIDASALGQFTGDYANFANDLEGATCTGDSTTGAEAAYFVDLTSGQTITATLIGSTADTALYIMDDLADPSSNCLVGDDAFGAPGMETVVYTATADMRVYIIADAWDDPTSGTFTLDLSVQ